jgi:hypothetical protein
MIPVKLPFRLPEHIVVTADLVENPALRHLWLCCDYCGGEEDLLVDAGRELYWTAGRFLDRHYGCLPLASDGKCDGMPCCG